MSSFEFFGVGRIVFGRGQFSRVAELAAPLGRTPLLVYNGDDMGRDGALDRLIELLAAQSIYPTLFRQRGEPTVDDIDRALASARAADCDCVIALGGGSAIDAGKAIAGLMTNGGAALDYMEVVGKGQKIVRPALPWMAIPTTAGTGAEATRNAVIGYTEKRFKASIRSELLLPRVALIDPEIQTGVPPAVTAASGMDALCQLIESYTSTGANPMTDGFAQYGIARVVRGLWRAYINGGDVQAREHMAMAALFSGITLTSAGLGAVHGLAAPLGANFPVPHGVVCARLLPPVIEANVRALRAQGPHPDVRRYAWIGEYFIGQGKMLTSEERAPGKDPIERLIIETSALVRDLHIPPLSSFGLTPEHIPEIIALARKSSSMRYNPVDLSDEALTEVLLKAG
jgi:alcohol dehydrogenase class IV